MKRFIALAGLSLLTLFRNPASAEEPVWCLLTDSGLAVAMDELSCLVAADDETTFGVVLLDGTVLDNIHRVTFEQTIPTSIKKPKQNIIRVNKELELEGVAPDTPVLLFDTSGKLRQKSTANLVQLTSLPAGIYIIQAGNTRFKIRKQ